MSEIAVHNNIRLNIFIPLQTLLLGSGIILESHCWAIMQDQTIKMENPT